MESGGSVDAGSLWCCVPVSFGRSSCQKDTPDFILNDPLISSLQNIFSRLCMCLPNTTLAFDSVSVAPPSIFCWWRSRNTIYNPRPQQSTAEARRSVLR
eukprot:s3000_g17.t1